MVYCICHCMSLHVCLVGIFLDSHLAIFLFYFIYLFIFIWGGGAGVGGGGN